MFNKSSFISVVNGGIWDSMLETFSGIEKYDMPIWEPQKVEGYPGVRAIFFEKTWMTDILSTDAFLSLLMMVLFRSIPFIAAIATV